MKFQKVVIVGGGVLGSQIALMSAYTGHDTTIWLRSEGSVERAKPKLERYAAMMLDDLEEAKTLLHNPMGAYLYPRGLILDWSQATEASIDQAAKAAKQAFSEKVHLSLDLAEALRGADIVIEAMSENPKAKISIYETMRDLLDEKTILCTNSSTLLPSAFAESTGRPEKYLALHFANQIWKSNTAEVMGHAGTDPAVYEAVVAFAKEIHMIPILLQKEQPGYVLNSLLVPFLEAGQRLWAKEVATPETIDLTWRLATRAPKGPFQMLDIIGLETAYQIAKMSPGAEDPSTVEYAVAQRLKEKIDRGETGMNAGKGFYDYTDAEKEDESSAQ